jgi:hypothetical protein
MRKFFSTRLMAFEEEKTMALVSYGPRAAEDSILGHAFFGETRACASSAACAGHTATLVRGKPGEFY